jgi:hypothetical protein
MIQAPGVFAPDKPLQPSLMSNVCGQGQEPTLEWGT